MSRLSWPGDRIPDLAAHRREQLERLLYSEALPRIRYLSGAVAGEKLRGEDSSDSRSRLRRWSGIRDSCLRLLNAGHDVSWLHAAEAA